MHVLIVDDVAANRRLPEVVLRRAGIPVSSVDSGPAALAAIERGDVTVVLLDLNMPEMNGIDVCVALRRRYAPEQLRLIAYTALVTEEDRDHLLSLGFDGLLIKPVAPKAILAAVGPVAQAGLPCALATAPGHPLPDESAGQFVAGEHVGE